METSSFHRYAALSDHVLFPLTSLVKCTYRKSVSTEAVTGKFMCFYFSHLDTMRPIFNLVLILFLLLVTRDAG